MSDNGRTILSKWKEKVSDFGSEVKKEKLLKDND